MGERSLCMSYKDIEHVAPHTRLFESDQSKKWQNPQITLTNTLRSTKQTHGTKVLNSYLVFGEEEARLARA